MRSLNLGGGFGTNPNTRKLRRNRDTSRASNNLNARDAASSQVVSSTTGVPRNRITNSSLEREREMQRRSTQNWTCTNCTLINEGGELCCRACGLEKPDTIITNMAPTAINQTLAQLRGLAPKPKEKLSKSDWDNLEYEAIKRGDASGACAICHETFGLDEQVILSCSHTFHRSCIASFERFLRTKERTCPVCRHASYQKKITSIGSFIKRQESCVVVQSAIRRWIVKSDFKAKLRLHYKSNNGVNAGRKRDFYAGEIGSLNDKLFDTLQAHEDSIDSLFAEFNRSLQMSREVFNPGTQSVPLSTMKTCAPAEEEETQGGPISIKKWLTILSKADERGDCECPICLSDVDKDNDNKRVILSCSHTFHTKCVEAFENFNIYEIQLCPVCRAGPYQKKMVDDLRYYADNVDMLGVD